MKIWLTAALFALTLPALAAAESDYKSDYKDEAPPPAEYPQPNAPEPGFSTPPPAQARPKARPLSPKSQAAKEADENAAASSSAVERPTSETDDGAFVYESGKQTSDAIEYGPTDSKDSTLYYRVKHKSRGRAAELSFGLFSPPDIINPTNQQNFKNIYGNSNLPTIFLNYEFRITKSVGVLGLKIGSGFFFANGTGRWANPDRSTDPQQPLEKFTFLMFPNTVGPIYHFRYADKQLFVPYVEGGGGFFTFMETRNDDVGPKFGGAAAAYALGGVSILCDWTDRRAMRELAREYGVSHLYLNVEVREIIGLNKKYDFSSRVVAGGLKLEF